MKHHLDKEEQKILDAIESGNWEFVKPKKAKAGLPLLYKRLAGAGAGDPARICDGGKGKIRVGSAMPAGSIVFFSLPA